MKIGALTKLGLFFPVVCFICVCAQTLAEQLYRDKGLLFKTFGKKGDFIKHMNRQGRDEKRTCQDYEYSFRKVE